MATVAADAASDLGINIFIITLEPEEVDDSRGICFGSDVSFNESLARGFGFGVTTADEEDLDDILVSILRQMPFHLVQ